MELTMSEGSTWEKRLGRLGCGCGCGVWDVGAWGGTAAAAATGRGASGASGEECLGLDGGEGGAGVCIREHSKTRRLPPSGRGHFWGQGAILGPSSCMFMAIRGAIRDSWRTGLFRRDGVTEAAADGGEVQLGI